MEARTQNATSATPATSLRLVAIAIFEKAITFEINNQLGQRNKDGIPSSNENLMAFGVSDLKFTGLFHIMACLFCSLISNQYDKQYE